MRKLIFLLSLLFCFSNGLYSSISELEARHSLLAAAKNDIKADEYYEKLKTVDPTKSPVLIGYKAMAEFMICHHSYNPYTKLSYFNKGKNTLEQIIEKNPDNVELRYLRYCIQTNVPSFLGYYSNKNEDKKVLIDFLRNSANEPDQDLVRIIKKYFLETGYCNEQEKQEILTL